jgi:hypothetical protein
VRHLDTGELAEDLGREVPVVAYAGRAVRELGVRALGVLDEFLQRVDRQGRIDREEQAAAAREIGHRREVLLGVIGKLLLHVRVHHESGRIHEQRVSVRRRLRHRVGADDAVGARLVLDEERLPELRSELRGHDSRHDVRSAGGGRHYDTHGTIRI